MNSAPGIAFSLLTNVYLVLEFLNCAKSRIFQQIALLIDLNGVRGQRAL